MSVQTLARNAAVLRSARAKLCRGIDQQSIRGISSLRSSFSATGTISSKLHYADEITHSCRTGTNVSRLYSSTKQREGIISRIFGGSGADESEKERKSILKRITGRKRVKCNLRDQSDAEAASEFEMREDGIFEHVATKEMTGVEPLMTQLCSTISAQLYSSVTIDDFKLNTKDIKTEIFVYDDHGQYLETSPPFLAAITGKTLILGWRGTNSLADALNDAACSPQSSLAWRKHAQTVKAQGAMTSIVHNDIANHEKAIIQKAKEVGVTEIITTGQSLGGGAAQIGHLTIRAQIEDEKSPWSELAGVNVRSIAFCAPMTTVLMDNATPETDLFLEKLWDNSVNFIYKNDVVPRAYGYLSFIEDFIDDATDDIADAVPVPRVLKRVFDFQGKLDDLVDCSQGNKGVEGLLSVLSNYRHIGSIIYYESEDAIPVVLEDMGAFHNNDGTATEDNLFRSAKYKPSKSPLKEFMGWHMDIIRGPGLSIPKSDLS